MTFIPYIAKSMSTTSEVAVCKSLVKIFPNAES